MNDSTLAMYFFFATTGAALIGWLVRNWAMNLKQSMEQIHEKMDNMNTWIQDHITVTERRLTRVETKVDMLVLDIERSPGKSRGKEDNGKTKSN